MNTTEAKKDLAKRLAKAGVTFSKITAKTVGFSDLTRSRPLFLTVHNPVFPKGWKSLNESGVYSGVPKPSEGGYIIQLD